MSVTQEKETLDRIDRKILNLLQTDFSLVPRPYLAIANAAGISEEECLERIKRLKDAGIIRQISAIFEGRKLGYHSVLVAMKFPPDKLDEGARIISEHPGVSHNYARNSEFNLWFTITVPKSADLKAIVSDMCQRAGGEDFMLLYMLRLFKIGVALDMEEGKGNVLDANPTSTMPEPERPLTNEDIEVVKALQEDLPVVAEPFKQVAESIGMTEDQLLKRARLLLREGRMRRFAAVLRHRTAGYTENAMVVWAVPEDKIEEIGQKMASFPQVSHAYQRPTRPDWHYSIFTMLHGRTKEQCEADAKMISEATGITDYRCLYSHTEYKKERVKYFTW